jgi:hypothetical protein
LFDVIVAEVCAGHHASVMLYSHPDRHDELWDTMWQLSKAEVTAWQINTPTGRAWSDRADYFIRRRVYWGEYSRLRFPGRRVGGDMDSWASRIYDRLSRELELVGAHAGQGAVQAVAIATARAQEMEKRRLVCAGRDRRLAEGTVTMQLNAELKAVNRSDRRLCYEDAKLYAQLVEADADVAGIVRRREEVWRALDNNRLTREAKVSIFGSTVLAIELTCTQEQELEDHRARVKQAYEEERQEIDALTPPYMRR